MPGYGAKQRSLENKEAVALAKIAGSGVLSTGRLFFVKDKDDVDRKQFNLDFPGAGRTTTIQQALDKCRNGANDYVFVCPQDDSAAWVQTENLDVRGKDGSTVLVGRDIHLIGVSAGPNRPEVSFAVAKALRIGDGAVTGDRTRGIEIANLKITASGTANIHCVEVGDSNGFTYDTWIHDCEIATTATTAAKAEIKDFGNDLLMERCTIGQIGTHPDDNYLQGAGAGAARFRDCIFLHKAAANGDQFVTLVTGAVPVFFIACLFHNASGTAMTVGVVAIDTAQAIFDRCGMTKATAMATTGKSLVTPGGMGKTVALADVFNPGMAIDGAEPVAVDTP